jgi:DNA mismatch endonuclease (patch repair protein)
MTETPEALRSRTMRAVKGKNTKPEWVIRRLLHTAGYRYRLHVNELPGKPDLVFAGRRKVIFVHGCFWHGHNCSRGAREPKTNAAYWKAKIVGNRERDKAHLAALRRRGWKVLIIWECEIYGAVLSRLKKFLGSTQRPKKSSSRRDRATR